jgi:hypothetical protein
LLPWLRFERRELSGFRLAELVASVGDEYRIGPPSWLGIVWYVLPVSSLAVWFTLVGGRPVRVRRPIHLPLGLAMSAVSGAFAVAAHRTVGIAPGAAVGVLASLVVVIGAALSPGKGPKDPWPARNGTAPGVNT